MSSHHIVRDNQEPALILMDKVPPYDLIQQLLEWAPTVIVNEESIDEVLKWDIKIDIVLCPSSEQVAIEGKTLHQQPLELLACPKEAELQIILQRLAERHYAAVNIVSNLPDWDLLTQFASKLTLALYANGMRWIYIRSGHLDKLVAPDTMFFQLINNEIIPFDHNGHIQIREAQPFWLGEQL